jgi:protein-tyrosine kinase
MGKTHEALERAEKEHRENLLETFFEPQKTMVTKGSRQISKKAMVAKESRKIPMKAPPNRYQEVKTRLITRFPEGSIKTILITGTAHGSGSSTTAANFAITLARDCSLNVLLVDANFRSPSLHEVFNIKYNQGLSQLLTKEEEDASLFKKVGHGNLYVLPCGENSSGPMNLFESIRFAKILKNMREKFDYVIFDAPPVNGYLDSIAICTKVDGVILVLESGNARRAVAIKAKQELEEAGAKVLGVILNRRKHYIPEWIYKRL